MISLIISLCLGLAAGFGSRLATTQYGWNIFFGVLGFVGGSVLINRLFTKKLQAIFNQVQSTLEAAKLEANKLIGRAQSTGKGGSPKMLQRKVEKMMAKAIKESLEILDQADPLFKWALLSERQVATYRMQLNYQIKEFDEVDRLLPKALLWEPLTVCMKMARLYKTDGSDEELAKVYKKGVRKFKGDKALLVYSTYAWILIKKKNFDRAQEVLTAAKEKIDREELERNWQALANDRPNKFSNSFLGDEWYTLHLEEQKTGKVKVSKGQLKNNPLYRQRGGKRRRR